MTRAFAIVIALLLAAAPVNAAFAQDGQQRGAPKRQEQSERPRISESQAQAIAQSRARGARFVGSRGLQGGSYVFVFDDGGRIFEISVPAN